MSIWHNLRKPFFVLAPMDDVTDTVFRQIIATCAPPDLFFTEFVNVDALQSKGRDATLKRLRFSTRERPIIAQLWGRDPVNFYKTSHEIANMGFDGIDLNFGCPDKNVVRSGACSALIKLENRSRAVEIIKATKEGGSSLPLSIKTRLGYNEIDYSWHKLLIEQNVNTLIIHGRTRKQMSKTPANWKAIGEIANICTALSPTTLIVGNGDVQSRQQGECLAKQYGLDGIMIGRGVFQDPFVFAENSPWSEFNKQQRIKLFSKHVELFAKTWQKDERKVHSLNKFCKIYIQGFPNAKELREKFMSAQSTEELLTFLDTCRAVVK